MPNAANDTFSYPNRRHCLRQLISLMARKHYVMIKFNARHDKSLFVINSTNARFYIVGFYISILTFVFHFFNEIQSRFRASVRSNWWGRWGSRLSVRVREDWPLWGTLWTMDSSVWCLNRRGPLVVRGITRTMLDSMRMDCQFTRQCTRIWGWIGILRKRKVLIISCLCIL